MIACILFLPMGAFLLARNSALSIRTRVFVLICVTISLIGVGVAELKFGVARRGWHWAVSATLRHRSMYLYVHGQHALALESGLEAFRRDPNDQESLRLAALSAAKLERKALARSLLSGGLMEPDQESETLVDLIALYDEDPATRERAVTLMKSAIDRGRVSPNHPQALLTLAGGDLRRHELTSAEFLLRQIVLQFRRNYFARVFRLLAETERARGNRAREVVYLCESLRVDPEHAATKIALDDAVKGLRLPPAGYRAFVRAVFMHDRMEARDQGRKLLERLLEKDPKFAFSDGCHYVLATHHFHYRRDYSRALVHYKTVIEKSRSSESYLRSLYQAGQCEEKMGRDQIAAKYYLRLRGEAPKGAELASMAEFQLNRMRRLGRVAGWIEQFGVGSF